MFETAIPLFGAIPGGPEMIVILLVLVLLFGANKIPKLAKSSGQAIGEFQKGREEVESELQEMRDGATDSDAGTGTGTGTGEARTESASATAEREEATESSS